MKTAFVFPGQGSQRVGMGKDLYENFPEAKAIFDKANEVLGFELTKVCFEGPEEKLKLTEIAQPAILTTSIALLECLKKMPFVTAGHSLGEYSALVCAKVISFEDAVLLVHKRGRFMQEAVPVGEGTMAAVLGLDREKILECCKNASQYGVVEVANYNSPGQIVISGKTSAVEHASKLCKEAGAKKIIPLQVSAPFHCSLMRPAADKLAKELDEISFNDAIIPVVSNFTAKPAVNAQELKQLLIKQITGSVLWEDSVNEMINLGVDSFVEIGAGRVLTGLIKKISESVKIYNIEDSLSLKEFLNQ